MDKLLAFATLLVVAVCVYAVVKILEQIWLELLITIASFGVVAFCVFVIWVRFRRW